MTAEDVVMIIRQGLFVVVKTAAVPLLVSLCVGLIVSIFQTVTSIQEQTLTMIPKIISVFTVLMIAGHWMLNNMTTFMTDLWSDFALYIR
ncbi:MAG: flagellar biosynthesis protein FliQ [bacterium]|nr:flagellar biosynthesis protein FliQ [Clostridium sp.]MCM1538330.1 flagellar biosynthesis protein FliQ [bacterium]